MKTSTSFSLLALTAAVSQVAAFGTVVNPDGPFPHRTETGQTGYNDCTTDSASAKCQTLRINSIDDFCLWAPATKQTVGDAEANVVSWCTKAGHGSRLIPKGTLKGAHFIQTPHYIQITGVGDFTKMNIPHGDEGGELDPHGADGNGNPKGSLVIIKSGNTFIQAQEWSQFISYNEFSIRACFPGSEAPQWCQHIYDVMGSMWNHPGNFKSGSFDSCKANDVALPPGEYKLANGQISTWHQGVKPTPAAQKPAKSSACKSIKTISAASYPKM